MNFFVFKIKDHFIFLLHFLVFPSGITFPGNAFSRIKPHTCSSADSEKPVHLL